MDDEHKTTPDEQQQLAVVETVGVTSQVLTTLYERPAGKSKVAASPLFTSIMDRFLAGWSGRRISGWLASQGHPISTRALEKYRAQHITPTGAITSMPLRNLLEDEVIVIDERRNLEEIIVLQRARCRALMLQESGVDNLAELGTRKEKFTHKPFLYKEMEALANMLRQLRQIRREEGALSALAEQSAAEEMVLEETTHRKLSMSSTGQVWRLLQGLEAIAENKPPDVTITEVDDDDHGGADGSGTAGTA